MKKTSEVLAPAQTWTRQPELSNLGLMRVMAWFSLAFGRAATRPVVYGAAAYFFVFAQLARRASADYLRRALGRAPTLTERFRHMLAFGTTIHDRIFLLSDQWERFDIEVVGDDALFHAARPDRGVILLGAHMGSFEILRTLGRQRVPARVSMVMYEDNARKINALLATLNPAASSDIIPLGRPDAMLRVSQTLDAGHYVGILGDRGLPTGGTFTREFLGAEATFPLGPLRMAALLRGSVFFMAGLYLGGNRYRIEFEPLVDFAGVEDGATRAELIRVARERYVDLLEVQCRRAPFSWFNFFDFWNSGLES